MNGGGFLDNKNDTYDKGNGAAIYIHDSTATFNKVLFSNNQFTYKSGHGAAIYAWLGSVVEVNDCKFINNGNWDEDTGAKGSVSVINMSGKMYIKNSVFEGNGSPEQNQYWGTTTKVLHIGCLDFTMDNCTFTKNHANGYVIENDSSDEDFVVRNSTFTNNDCGVYEGDAGEFINCTFDQNGGTYTFGDDGEYFFGNVTLRDCNLGNSTFEKAKYVVIVDTDAENGIASIFSQGSLTMIVSFLSLIASGVAIFLVVYYNKKKAVTVAANSVAETENDEEE
jgi:hypothetical protein